MFRTKCKEHDHSSFYQFLQMEHSRKNTDCYFFYYSTCKKGDLCPFRHEPSALGCEMMCSYWQQGNCLNEHCNFRHMELKKNRKSIPCYWEGQPRGCTKPHCPFQHSMRRIMNMVCTATAKPVKAADSSSKPINQEWLNRQEDTKYDGSSTESDQGRGSSEAGSFSGSPAVDPLIVKFEEESDNESVPSPVKPQPRVPYCKTYEEIRLEEIQAESAAYYSYEPEAQRSDTAGGKIRTIARSTRRVCVYPKVGKEKAEQARTAKELDFEVLTLEEIRRRKRRKALEEELAATSAPKELKLEDREEPTSFLKDAIKTLAELRVATATWRGIKRTIEECNDSDSDLIEEGRVKSRGATDIVDRPVKVPPVRLRRSPKRISALSRSESTEKPLEDEVDGRGRAEERTVSDSTERLAEVRQEARQSKDQEEETASLGRRSEVEVRLCDSSTDEDQTGLLMGSITSSKDERKSGTMDSTDDPKVPHHLSCDSLLNINDDDYLTLDTASDDILKDIDALLKDKTV
ncbi:hypothetical protein KM043_005311 [Ampulex compressa]|nr:hypothetical protein KM043_005311 [Ampulex compressa]